MNKKGKAQVIGLFVVLGMPVLVVLFLYLFGKNRFDVPVYYQTGIESDATDCPKSGGQHFVVPPAGVSFPGQLTLMYSAAELDAETKRQLLRLCDKFEDRTAVFLFLSSGVFSPPGCVENVVMPEKELKAFISCSLVLQHPNQFVLIDGQGRIRGYYDSGERKETDRLVMEMEILIQNNEHGGK